jgi:hypothetical protein
MTDAGATRNATARMSYEGISRSPRAGPPGYSGVTRSACIQRYMIRTRATGGVNSGLWVAMAIVESCGFHDTSDAPLHMSVIGTQRPSRQ